MANSTQFKAIVLAGYLDVGNIRYFYFTLLLVLYLAIIFANVLLIGVIYVKRALHEPMYLFLCSLSFNELFGSTALFPTLLMNILSDTHEVPLNFCYTQIFSMYSYARIEYNNLAVMSYDRYISICRPLQYSSIMTVYRVALYILLVWVCSFCDCSITLILAVRLELCGNVIGNVWCDNFLIIKLACSDTTINNLYGLYNTTVTISVPVSIILFSYMKILSVCLKSAKDTKQKAINTCTPHIVSLLNFSLGCFFVVLQSRFNKIQMPAILRIFISVYFLICPPLFNPIMYGLRLTKLRKMCANVLFAETDNLRHSMLL